MQTHLKDQHNNERKNRFRVWQSHPLVAYLVVAYAITWLFLGQVVLSAHGLLSLPSSLIFPLTFVGSIGPLPAALLVTATTTSKGGMRAFFRQWFIWRVNLRWYLVVLFEPVIVTFIAMVGTFSGRNHFRFRPSSSGPASPSSSSLWHHSLAFDRPAVSSWRSAWWPGWRGTRMAWICAGKAPGSIQCPGGKPHPWSLVDSMAPSILLPARNGSIGYSFLRLRARHSC